MDSSESPVAGVRVHAAGRLRLSGVSRAEDLATGTSGPDGSFELVGLRRDLTHAVWLESPGSSPTLRVVARGAARVDLGAIELAQEASLEGRVVDRRGRPAVGIEVGSGSNLRLLQGAALREHARLGAGRDAAFLETRFRTSTRTDAEGRFLLAGLPGAEVSVQARWTRGTDALAYNAQGFAREGRPTLVADLVLAAELDRLDGTVAGGAGAPALEIELVAPGAGRLAASPVSADGSFSLSVPRISAGCLILVREGDAVLWVEELESLSSPLVISL